MKDYMEQKSLNKETYSKNICYKHTLDVTFNNLNLIISKSAKNEMIKYCLDLEDCKYILENGYSPRKRSKNKIEKWFDKGNKTYNVVIVKDFNHISKENIYLIIHIGKFTKIRRIKK